MLGLWSLALALWLCLLATGCGPREGLPVRHWQLGEHELVVPGHVDPGLVEEDQPYVLRARVTLPSELRGRAVAFSLPLFEAPLSLWVDEHEIPIDVGRGYREAGPRRWTIPARDTEDGELFLSLVVEHTWVKSAWFNTVPVLLPSGRPDARADRVRVFNVYVGWMAMGLLVQVGVTCLVIFALDRRRRPYLWFGIQAVSAMSYPGFTSGVSVGVWGRWDLLVLELGLVVALGASLRFTHGIYGLGRVPRWLWASLGIAGGVSLVVSDPFLAATTSARAVATAVALCIVHQLVVLARLYARQPEHRVSVALLGCGWGALAAGTWVDLADWLLGIEILGGVRPACLGLALFGMFLSLVLSRRHTLSLSQADELNAALAEKIEQVEAQRAHADALNEELRRQIADRSAQLFTALALLESGDAGVGALPPGTEVNGRYRIERVLGSGAMGMVYLVTRLSDGSRWAMKIANELRGVTLARLAREAHIASKLRHDNVVEIRDIDVSTRGFMYIVLELVEGQSLRERLRQQGPLPLPEALPILEQLATGLHALHHGSIAHRDLKPDNVLLTERDGALVVKIADFGISRLGELEEPSLVRPRRRSTTAASASASLQMVTGVLRTEGEAGEAGTVVGGAAVERDADTVELREPGPVDEASVVRVTVVGFDEDGMPSSLPTLGGGVEIGPGPGAGLGTGTPSSQDLTGTGMLAGTPHYVAPELALGGARADPRADLFSFGVVAFEMLTGRRPFDEAVSTRLLQRRAVDDLPAPSLPDELAVVAPLVLRCLSFDPAHRPTASEAAQALRRMIHETEEPTGSNEPTGPTAPTGPTGPTEPTGPTGPTGRRSGD